MRLRSFALFLGLTLTGLTYSACGAPYLPSRDDEVIERLPLDPKDPLARELRALRAALAAQPGDLQLALQIAGRYASLGRETGDPRYAGYAQAALSPWWEQPLPPEPVLVLRATLKQRTHEFDAALADLDLVLRANPQQAQARLTRATILQVQARYALALEECRALRKIVAELVWGQCVASVSSLNGALQSSYAYLGTLVQRTPESNRLLRGWAITTLAEMAERADLVQEADRHYRDALAATPSDLYVLAAYADFLIARKRFKEAAELVSNYEQSDTLLLRSAVAHAGLGSPDAKRMIMELSARFDAARRRGDRAHQREEARFRLQLAHDPGAALTLALENWNVQKEPADLRVLVQAAAAVGDRTTLQLARDWIARHRYQDAYCDRLLAAAPR